MHTLEHPVLGPLRLGVSRLESSREFFGLLLGLGLRDTPEGLEIRLPSGATLATLEERPGALPDSPALPGLYHLALKVPHRPALARILLRLREAGWPLEGPVDHGVSEALYLEGPEELGLEIYRDHSREAWPTRGGHLAMGSRLVPEGDLLAQAEEGTGTPDLEEGHLHLRVSDLRRSVSFYTSLLPLRVTQEDYPGAAFLAFGDYHHHLGLNVWSSQGSVPRTQERSGLIEISFLFRTSESFRTWEEERDCRGLLEPRDRAPDGSWVLFRDPDGWDVRVRRPLD